MYAVRADLHQNLYSELFTTGLNHMVPRPPPSESRNVPPEQISTTDREKIAELDRVGLYRNIKAEV